MAILRTIDPGAQAGVEPLIGPATRYAWSRRIRWGCARRWTGRHPGPI